MIKVTLSNGVVIEAQSALEASQVICLVSARISAKPQVETTGRTCIICKAILPKNHTVLCSSKTCKLRHGANQARKYWKKHPDKKIEHSRKYYLKKQAQSFENVLEA